MTPQDRVGSVTGIVGAVGGLGGFVPPLLMGAVYSAKGSYSIGFMLLSDLAPAGCVYAYGRMRNLEPSSGSAAGPSPSPADAPGRSRTEPAHTPGRSRADPARPVASDVPALRHRGRRRPALVARAGSGSDRLRAGAGRGPGVGALGDGTLAVALVEVEALLVVPQAAEVGPAGAVEVAGRVEGDGVTGEEATVKAPTWALSGTHSVVVRPNPKDVSCSPTTGALVATLTGSTPTTRQASFTITRSRFACGTSSTASTTVPVD